MKITELIQMYEEGGITGYQVMMDSLQMLDPDHPELVLAPLPSEILDEMMHYAQRYVPYVGRSPSHQPPAENQVRSAERWIQEHDPGHPVRPIKDAPAF